MHGEYSDNYHTYMANAAIWVVNLWDFRNKPQELSPSEVDIMLQNVWKIPQEKMVLFSLILVQIVK